MLGHWVKREEGVFPHRSCSFLASLVSLIALQCSIGPPCVVRVLSCRAVYRLGMLSMYLSIRQAATTLSARSSREKEELSPLLPERCATRKNLFHWLRLY